jgi:hypothetical protein
VALTAQPSTTPSDVHFKRPLITQTLREIKKKSLLTPFTTIIGPLLPRSKNAGPCHHVRYELLHWLLAKNINGSVNSNFIHFTFDLNLARKKLLFHHFLADQDSFFMSLHTSVTFTLS